MYIHLYKKIYRKKDKKIEREIGYPYHNYLMDLKVEPI